MNPMLIAPLLIAAIAAPPQVEPRTIDGTNNNLVNPDWGSAGVQLLRLTTPSYADAMNAPAGEDRPGTRQISNLVCAQSASIPNAAGASDYLWQWGQFIDHDITFVGAAVPTEPFNIPVPKGDPWFDPNGTGTVEIMLKRSQFDPASGSSPDIPREQTNSITAYLDASMVYGSDPVRAAALRTLDGTGRLKTSAGNLLPFNVDGLPNAGGPDPSLFLAGDVRANEQVGLTALHTLFVREHNRLVDSFANMSWLDGDGRYELARAVVGAEIQAITNKEFLPLLLGPDAIAPYAGYDEQADAGISNIFATGAYRVGHTLLPSILLRLEADGAESPAGHLPLREAFFAVDEITNGGGIDPILRGLGGQLSEEVDPFLVDDVRNFLFGPPGAGGFDLAALNMQRGRDHGLPSYNQSRIDFGLAPAETFADVSSDPGIASSLAAAYGDVELLDTWVGGLAEDHVPGAMVGELLQAIMADQFVHLRDGDRFWYQQALPQPYRNFVESVRLSDVIRWNTGIGDELQDEVFQIVAGGCQGDVDGDGHVNVSDLLAVLVEFGGAGGPADLNGDGQVDVIDLLLVLQNWGPCSG